MRKDFLSVSSELMENTVSTDYVINILNEVIMKLDESKDTEARRIHIDKFNKDINSWHIVAAKPAESSVWMQIPMKYYEVERKYSILERTKIFIDKGLWISKYATERYIDIISSVKIPMEIELDPLNFSYASRSDEDKFYYSIKHLIKRIEGILVESDSLDIAIYKKPFGITAMNIVNHWINELEKETQVDTGFLRRSLETVSFSDLIIDSEIKMNIDNNIVDSKTAKTIKRPTEVEA